MPNNREYLPTGIQPTPDAQNSEAPSMAKTLDADLYAPKNGDAKTPVSQTPAPTSKAPDKSQKVQNEMMDKINADPTTMVLSDEDKIRLMSACQELNRPDPVEFYRDMTAHNVTLTEVETAIHQPSNVNSNVVEFLEEHGFDKDKYMSEPDKERELAKKDPSREQDENKENNDAGPVIVGGTVGAASTANGQGALQKGAPNPTQSNVSPLDTNVSEPAPVNETTTAPTPIETAVSLPKASATGRAGLNSFKINRAGLDTTTPPAPTSHKPALEP